MTPKQVAKMTLFKPFQLNFSDPILFALNLYLAFVYAVLYSWFEAFPLVYEQVRFRVYVTFFRRVLTQILQMYGMSLPIAQLPFAALLVGSLVALVGYILWHKWVASVTTETANLTKARSSFLGTGGFPDTTPPTARFLPSCDYLLLSLEHFVFPCVSFHSLGRPVEHIGWPRSCFRRSSAREPHSCSRQSSTISKMPTRTRQHRLWQVSRLLRQLAIRTLTKRRFQQTTFSEARSALLCPSWHLPCSRISRSTGG